MYQLDIWLNMILVLKACSCLLLYLKRYYNVKDYIMSSRCTLKFQISTGKFRWHSTQSLQGGAQRHGQRVTDISGLDQLTMYIASINLNVKLVILTKCFVNSPLIGFISMHVLLLNSYLLFLTYSVCIYKLISVLYRSMTEKYLKAPNIFTKLQKRPLSTMYNACSIQDDNHNNKFIFKHSLRVRIGRNTS